MGEDVMSPRAVMTKTDPGVTPQETSLIRQALAALHTHYPGHPWGGEVISTHLVIRHKSLTGRYGYRINLMTTPDIHHAAKQAGGEILERYRQPRTGHNPDIPRDGPRDARRILVPDL